MWGVKIKVMSRYSCAINWSHRGTALYFKNTECWNYSTDQAALMERYADLLFQLDDLSSELEIVRNAQGKSCRQRGVW